MTLTTVADLFWWHPSGILAQEDVAPLRGWTTLTVSTGRLAAVTEIGSTAEVIKSAGHISAKPAHRYGPSCCLSSTLRPRSAKALMGVDLVRMGADGNPHWSRVWRTSKENPRHAGWGLCMAADGHLIVSRPASEFDLAARGDFSWPRAVAETLPLENLVKSRGANLPEKLDMPPTPALPIWHTCPAIHPKQRSA